MDELQKEIDKLLEGIDPNPNKPTRIVMHPRYFGSDTSLVFRIPVRIIFSMKVKAHQVIFFDDLLVNDRQ